MFLFAALAISKIHLICTRSKQAFNMQLLAKYYFLLLMEQIGVYSSLMQREQPLESANILQVSATFTEIISSEMSIFRLGKLMKEFHFNLFLFQLLR